MCGSCVEQVVLRVVCLCVVAGLGHMDLLLHLLTNVAPFNKVSDAILTMCPSRARCKMRAAMPGLATFFEHKIGTRYVRSMRAWCTVSRVQSVARAVSTVMDRLLTKSMIMPVKVSHACFLQVR